MPWDGSGEGPGKHGIAVGIRWAAEDALGLMAGGWEGSRATGGNRMKRDLEEDHPRLVEGSMNNWVELEYGGHVGRNG